MAKVVPKVVTGKDMGGRLGSGRKRVPGLFGPHTSKDTESTASPIKVLILESHTWPDKC